MTLIMGILNVTPDSFSDGGRYVDPDAAVAHALHLVGAGADLVDVGGESTRPGAERVDAVLEQERVVPVVAELARAGITVSVDTMNASTALATIQVGARIINDVSGGLADPAMFEVVASTDAEIAIGHWRGHSADMYARADYDDIVLDVMAELDDRVDAAAASGIAPARIIVDPGIGFGKHAAQNWDVLRGLDRIVGTGRRVLVGTSRKRFLAEALHGEATQARRDLATAVTSVLAAQAGAWAVRVHDVGATRDALAVAHHAEGSTRWTSSTRSA